MLDSFIKTKADPWLGRWTVLIVQSGLTANTLTLLAMGFGFGACFCLGQQIYPLGLVLLLLSRALAGFAGMLARITTVTPLGSYIAILCDFFIFASFVFFFSLGVRNSSLAGEFLIFGYLMMAVAYLGQTTFASRVDLLAVPRGGLIEKTEITLFMVACCVYPAGFPAMAPMFALLCWTTAVVRAFQTIKLLKS